MSEFQPTPEQAAIVEAATSTTDNLLIRALAGAAKTSTLVLIGEALPKVQILTLAFNVRIKKEMQERLPSNCEALTLNGLGHRAWGSFLGKRLILDDKKTYRITKELVEALGPTDRAKAYERFADIMNAVNSGKTVGYIPTGTYPHMKPLMQDDEFFAGLDEEPSALEESLIREATIVSLGEAMKGTIDFADQLLLPTVTKGVIFPYYPLVLVDEAQDLSELNHVMLKKVAKKRLIAVGDECQSIYGFRGAHQHSMNLLKESFDMKDFGLSISFRCPISVVEAARWRAPNMAYPAWAKEGAVASLSEWDYTTPQDFAAVICRNNAPLFSLAMRMLRDGRYVELVGNDIGKNLLKTLTKLGEPSMKQAAVLAAIADWETAKKLKARNPARVEDQAECLRIFARQGSTLDHAVAYARRLLDMAGPVKLMTGHKSKGLEFDHVYFLDEHLVRKDDQQDKNLRYVIQTRAKETLTYIYSEDYETEEKTNA